MTQSTESGVKGGITKKLAAIAASFIGAFIALYPINPGNATLPSRDSGVFLYVGWRWLNGDIPYKDVWDHKPPLVYVVDALGLALTPDSMWGVWILQFIFIFLALFVIYKVLSDEFGAFAALSGAIVFTSGLLALLEQGNVTEGYALVFQAIGIFIFVRAQRADYPLHSTFWLGLTAGLAFNFKQTTVGVWIAFALILAFTRLRQRIFPWRDGLRFLAGFFLPTAIIVVYFASQNALTDFWEQAYLYNFIYINKHEGIRSLIPVFTKGFLLLLNGGIFYLLIVSWLVTLVFLWRHRKTNPKPLALFAALGLPIEVLLITTSGRSIIHYYLTLLPVASVLIGSLAYTIPALLGTNLPAARRLMPAIPLVVILLLQVKQVRNYPNHIAVMGYNEYAPVIEYVRQNTEEGDKVLVIGAESAVNFLTRREAPTRYVYQYPLQLLGRRPMFEEYFNDILANQPILIIDTRGRTSITDNLYEPLQKRSEIVKDGVAHLGENYEQVAQFGEWFVYRLIP
ncbi:MAG: glycosyltransferase family 39 protein [Anaerolineales bacterium]|nr:glycosyltransferase family 39 protein [Anaerolineales bacterium]